MIRVTVLRSCVSSVASCPSLLLAVSLFLVGRETTGEEVLSSGAPQSVSENNFQALKSHSPFHRSLNLSQSLILTGIARMEGKLYATLFDVESSETHVVSKSTNSNGWRMIEVKGDEADLESLTVQILVTEGEVVSVRYEKEQLQAKREKSEPASRGYSGRYRSVSEAAANYRQGISGDGFRGPPPPEMVAKLSKLSSKQREALILKFGELRQRGVSSEERRELFVREVDKTLGGKR